MIDSEEFSKRCVAINYALAKVNHVEMIAILAAVIATIMKEDQNDITLDKVDAYMWVVTKIIKKRHQHFRGLRKDSKLL